MSTLPKDSFFNTVKHCLYDPDYFHGLVSKTFFDALKYLYLLIVLTLFIGSVKTAITLIPQTRSLPTLVQNITRFVKAGYPKDLVVTVKNGQLQTNAKEPYFIELPIIDEKTRADNYHFITIDTKARYEDFSKYRTAILITKTGIITNDGNKKTLKIYPLENYNFVMNQSKYDQFTNMILPYVNYLPTIIIVLVSLLLILSPFIAALFMLIGQLIFLLLAAFLFFITAKILKKNLAYKTVYILSLYGLTLPIVLNTIKNLIPSLYQYIGQGVSIQTWSLATRIYNGLPQLLYFILMVLVIARYKNQSDKSQLSPQSISTTK